jgi:BTB/POZ domain
MATPSATSEAASSPSRSRRDGSSDKLFDDPDADIILRSSDSREFRVLKLYLIKCSPVLNGLIQAAASNLPDAAIPPNAGTPLPVVKMSDSGAILSSLLTFIFPMSPVLPQTLEETMELLSVAQKYKMSSVLSFIRGRIAALQDPPFIHRENAFHVYSLAQKHGLHHEVAQAARMTLKFTLTIEKLEGKLDIIPSAYLYELWLHHNRVKTNISSDILEFRESGAHGTLIGLKCVRLTVTPGGIPQWIDDYICSIAQAPSFFDLFKFQTTLAGHIDASRCSSCAYMPSQTIHAFWSALTDLVHQSMEKVRVFDINGVACSYNSYRQIQLSPCWEWKSPPKVIWAIPWLPSLCQNA